MTSLLEEPAITDDDAGYRARRRDLMRKLAAGALATPVVLSSVTANATRISSSPPPP